MSKDKIGYQGTLRPHSLAGEFNATSFLVKQMLLKMETCTLVEIKSVTNTGGASPVGFVDVHPLVQMVDGSGNPFPGMDSFVIYNIPYIRVQGGANAIIMDPEVGDIGLCAFASRDISKIKATKKTGLPDSERSFSLSDGIYLGGCLNSAPTQYVQFNASGITITSPTAVTINAPQATINAPVSTITASTSATVTTPTLTVNSAASSFTGAVTVNGLLTGAAGLAISGGSGATITGSLTQTSGSLSSNGIVLSTHTHSGVTTGTGNTGAPV